MVRSVDLRSGAGAHLGWKDLLGMRRLMAWKPLHTTWAAATDA